MAATAIGGNYALSGLPNIEFSSVTVFLSGFLFGTLTGALVGLISMTVYSVWNPWGPFIPPIGGTMIACTVFIGIIGGIAGRNINSAKVSGTKWFTGPAVIGFTVTLFYDLATNYAYSLAFGVPYTAALVFGLSFSLTHIAANTLLFSLLTPPVVRAIRNLQIPTPTTTGKERGTSNLQPNKSSLP